MKKVIIFIFGTVITSCSMQKKAIAPIEQAPIPVIQADSTPIVEDMSAHQQEHQLPPIVVETIKQSSSQDTIIPPSKKEASKEKVVQPSQKILYGHIDMKTIITNMGAYKTALQQMDSLQKYLDNQYNLMIQEYQQKDAEYRADTASLLMVQQMRQKELQSLAERIKYFQETSQQQLLLEENKLMAPIYEKIQSVVQLVSEELHLSFVFENNSLAYFSKDAIDITNMVIQKLNEP